MKTKPLSEKELFQAMGIGYPSEEQMYRFQERIAIMCGTAEPTPEAIRCAFEDVRRFDEDCYRANFPKP